MERLGAWACKRARKVAGARKGAAGAARFGGALSAESALVSSSPKPRATQRPQASSGGAQQVEARGGAAAERELSRRVPQRTRGLSGRAQNGAVSCGDLLVETVCGRSVRRHAVSCCVEPWLTR